MSGRRKRRVNQHLMEEKSFSIVRNLLPDAWVIHDYRPDYGIDFTIEAFEPVDGNVSETLGEHLFVQLKSVQSLSVKSIFVSPRYNVEKRPLSQSEVGAETTIEVIPFQIDTNDLVTVQAMGAAAPVLLVLVALDCNRVFFLCLNDLVDKVVELEDPEFRNKGTKQIMIPLRNEITNSASSLIPLRLYSKRAKFYTAFSKFTYQQHELSYAFESFGSESQGDAFSKNLLYYIKGLRALTIWDACEYWPLLKQLEERLNRMEAILDGREATKLGVETEAEILWQQLSALGRNFEEVSREMFLPTSLSDSMRQK